jgi:uncharacterized protein DUF5994
MTTSIPESPTATAPVNERVGLRLRLLDPTAPGAVDGSWWPQSRDLAVELRDLVDHFPKERGQVHRVVFSRPDWDTAPHRMRVGRGLIKVGSYPHDDTHQVWLSMSTQELIRLSVQAPEGASAPAVPTAPTAPGPPRRIAAADEPDTDAAEHWTDDGGSWWAPHRVAPSQRT